MNVHKILAQAKVSYNYCGVCGSTPKTNLDEPNYAPLKWWDCDDGWKIGTLCSYCAKDVLGRKPKPEDFAYKTANNISDNNINTDEDV